MLLGKPWVLCTLLSCLGNPQVMLVGAEPVGDSKPGGASSRGAWSNGFMCCLSTLQECSISGWCVWVWAGGRRSPRLSLELVCPSRLCSLPHYVKKELKQRRSPAPLILESSPAKKQCLILKLELFDLLSRCAKMQGFFSSALEQGISTQFLEWYPPPLQVTMLRVGFLLLLCLSCHFLCEHFLMFTQASVLWMKRSEYILLECMFRLFPCCHLPFSCLTVNI